MSPDRLSSGFDALRPWRGSRARAFEELCYQLFARDTPDGVRAIRTGDPDGGVEWYADLADGSRWGWQAKHVHDLDALLTGMTKSVKAAVLDHPKLAKLTFIISTNLNTATEGGARKSQRTKYDDKVASWRTSIDGVAGLMIELIQESDVLARLALPEHAGRQWFWWGTTEFTEAWYHAKLKAQVDVAGEKYRPDLQVDLPIEDDLAALGFDDSVLDRLDELRRAVLSAAADFWLAEGESVELRNAYDAIVGAVEQMKAALSSLHVEPPTIAPDLEPIQQALKTLSAAVRAGVDLERAAEERWRVDHPDQHHLAARENSPRAARGYRTDSLLKPVRELERWLDSSVGQALQRGLYFLEGPAGAGKTHLLLEATHRALQAGRPAVFLSAASFGRSDLWSSMCDQLGLPPLGADVLLGAMDAAGEASALTGRRFVISIDALNDTIDTEFWQTHLPMLRAVVSQWPHVSLAVSCRDTYLEIACDDSEQARYVMCTHPGFAGREVDATHKFFAFHGLQAPRIPLLLPEFSLPLFLKLFCEGLRESGATSYAGHEGRVAIFQRYLEAKLTRIARRLRPQAATEYELNTARSQVTAVLDAILDEFAKTGREGLTLVRAEELAAAALGQEASAKTIVLGAMLSEGILNQELLYLGRDDDMTQGLRIVFQALADFMILRRRLDRSPDPLTDTELHAWLREDCSRGIVEAAAVMLPELHAVELPDLLGITAKALRRPNRDDTAARRRFFRDEHILSSVVQTLPYRKAAAVTDRTIELLDESLRFIRREDLFQVMFLLAPQPENQLNSERLHEHLARFSMPNRDAYFGFATYHALSDETNAAAVLARWASTGPYPTYDSKVIELATIPLAWLLGSPNRYMRDWVTKALVQLLRGHIAVTERLLVRFWSINDPYIVQRVMVIAYGAVMRSDTTQRDAAKKLVARVRALVFSPPVRADELLLDAARGIVEWGVTNGLAPKSQLNSIRRPYGLKPPGPVPKEDRLEARYGWKEDQSDEESYSTILASVLDMGDFGRYVIEPGLREFSRYPIAKPYPNPAPNESPVIVKSRWVKFIKSLSSDQQDQLADLINTQPNDEPFDQLEALRSGFWSSLTKEQSRLLSESYRRPRSRLIDDEYPAERAKRWIFMRTLRLGWTPERFGAADRYLGYQSSGRDAHKSERWGKKYQWMAYHELLARVADNFHASRRFADHQPYEGLHQIIADREIDPSLPPVPFAQLLAPETGNDTWRPSRVSFPKWPPVPVNFARFEGILARFLDDIASEPALDRVVMIDDNDGELWILLDASIDQGDPNSDKPWSGLQQTFHLNSWFVPAPHGASLLSYVPRVLQSGRHDLIDSHGHVDCCYFGEIGWSPHDCPHRHADFAKVEVGGDEIAVVSTVEDYTWEGSLYDCSINESVVTTLPSAFVRSRFPLTMDEHGPSWSDNNTIVFTNQTAIGRHRQRGFLVRANWLQTFLKKYNLELLLAGSTLRWRVTSGSLRSRDRDPEELNRLDLYTAARLNADLKIELAPALRLRNNEEITDPEQ